MTSDGVFDFTWNSANQLTSANCFDCLRDVLDRNATTPTSQLEDMLPYRWQAARGS